MLVALALGAALWAAATDGVALTDQSLVDLQRLPHFQRWLLQLQQQQLQQHDTDGGGSSSSSRSSPNRPATSDPSCPVAAAIAQDRVHRPDTLLSSSDEVHLRSLDYVTYVMLYSAFRVSDKYRCC